MASLRAQYIKEREDTETFEKEDGYIEYEILADADSLHIKDVFIVKEKRGQGILREYYNEVVNIAKENDCQYIVTNYDKRTNGWQHVEDILIAEKFDFLGEKDGYIIMQKGICHG
jgi:predicted GNAT family acetyltransferase